MNQIQSDVIEELTKVGKLCRKLPDSTARALAETIRAEFCVNQSDDPIWEALQNAKAHYREERLPALRTGVEHFAGAIFMLIDDWDGLSAIEIGEAEALVWIFESMYSFVWYATDAAASYLLCTNDHEFLFLARSRALRDLPARE